MQRERESYFINFSLLRYSLSIVDIALIHFHLVLAFKRSGGREEEEEEEEEKNKCGEETKLKNQSLRRINFNHSVNKNIFLSLVLITYT